MAGLQGALHRLSRAAKSPYEKSYMKTWRDFASHVGLTDDVEPTEDMFIDYFNFLRHSRGFSGNTIMSQKAKLKRVLKEMYGKNFREFIRCNKMVLSFTKGETIKRSKVFRRDQLEKFVTEADTFNRWNLVRMAIVTIAYCGGHRMNELRTMKQRDAVECENGFVVSYTPSHQRDGATKRVKYLIKNGAPGEVCWASVLRIYLHAVRQDLPEVGPDDPLFLSGRTTTQKGESKFFRLPFGRNRLFDVGKDVAKWLGLPDPERHTGHCFRRSAAAEIAAARTNDTEFTLWGAPRRISVQAKQPVESSWATSSRQLGRQPGNNFAPAEFSHDFEEYGDYNYDEADNFADNSADEMEMLEPVVKQEVDSDMEVDGESCQAYCEGEEDDRPGPDPDPDPIRIPTQGYEAILNSPRLLEATRQNVRADHSYHANEKKEVEVEVPGEIFHFADAGVGEVEVETMTEKDLELSAVRAENRKLREENEAAVKSVAESDEALAKVFGRDQLDALAGKIDAGFEWSDETMDKAEFLLHKCGADGYQALLDSGLPFPQIIREQN